MPVYEYECPNCGLFEETRRMTESRRKRCPKCRYKVEIVYSATSIIFKGDGWYVTDYKNKSNPQGERTIAKLKNRNSKVPEPKTTS